LAALSTAATSFSSRVICTVRIAPPRPEVHSYEYSYATHHCAAVSRLQALRGAEAPLDRLARRRRVGTILPCFHAGVQVVAELGVLLADAHQRVADALRHREAGTLDGR